VNTYDPSNDIVYVHLATEAPDLHRAAPALSSSPTVPANATGTAADGRAVAERAIDHGNR
jgi:hypothetical protein